MQDLNKGMYRVIDPMNKTTAKKVIVFELDEFEGYGKGVCSTEYSVNKAKAFV